MSENYQAKPSLESFLFLNQGSFSRPILQCVTFQSSRIPWALKKLWTPILYSEAKSSYLNALKNWTYKGAQNHLRLSFSTQ
jgi:hypothetical protein